MHGNRTTPAAVVTVLLALAGCTGQALPPLPAPSTPPTPSTSSTPTTTPTPSPSPTPTPTPSTLAQAYEQARSGVVRIEVAGCKWYGMGSGFLIAPQLVVTAAHVVGDTAVIRVIAGTTAVAGRVLGLDPRSDVALVETAAPLPGQPLRFADVPVRVAERIAAIGYPEGGPLNYTEGTVNGLDRKAEIGGLMRYGLFEYDAATHPGSSGGPVLRVDGTVVGFVDAGPAEPAQGRRLAVASGTASALVSLWRAHPVPVSAAPCLTLLDPGGVPVTVARPSPAAQQAFLTLYSYFNAVNFADFSTAAAQLARPGPFDTFVEGVRSTSDAEFAVRDVTVRDRSVTVWLDFVSRQEAGRGPKGRPGETCTAWSLDYVLVPTRGLWLIDRVGPHPGVPPNAPCPPTS